LRDEPFVFMRPSDLPIAEPDHQHDRRRDNDRGNHRNAPFHITRPSRARCRYSWASSHAFDSLSPPSVSAVATGIHTRWTHQGGEKTPSTTSAATTVIVPTMKIRKAAGPSPTLKLSKSRPQLEHLCANRTQPAKSVCAPQRGQLPFKAAASDDGASSGLSGITPRAARPSRPRRRSR